MKNLLHKCADNLHDSLYAITKQEPIIRRMKQPDRNDLCKCGSNKKFKHCCINKKINYDNN